MVWFFYLSVYPDREEYVEFGVFDGLRFSHHLLVRDLAKKFVLPALALLAKKHFIKAVEDNWNIDIFYDCIPIIYGEQPEPDSTLRKIAAPKMKLNLEWDAESSDLWVDFQRYVQSFPLFASDVPAALYAKPILKSGLTLMGGSKRSWDVQPGRSDFSVSPTPFSTTLIKRCLGHVFITFDEDDYRYDAALFQTNPRGNENNYCWLRIIKLYTKAQAKKRYVTDLGYGMVGGLETVTALGRDRFGDIEEVDGATECFSDAVDVFEEKFKDLTGLGWANRYSQPVKAKYTYIGERRNGVLQGWENAVSKPL